MSGDTWIAIGVVAAAITAFSIPYGFYKKSKEKPHESETPPVQISQSGDDSKVVAGDYVEGDKVEVGGDYVKGDKVVIDQRAESGSGFTQIINFLGPESSGIFVTLVFNVADFIAEKKGAGKPAGVEDYLKWLREQDHQKLPVGLNSIVDAVDGKDEQAQLIRSSIETLIRHVERHTDTLQEILEQTKSIPEMNSKMDYIVDQLSKKTSPSLRKGQLAISARVLDTLSEGIIGSGVKIMLKKGVDVVDEGSAMVVWLLGTKSPNMVLFDLVGDILQNRISLILNDDVSISLRAYDDNGQKVEVQSRSYPPTHYLVILATWQGQRISLWINGEKQGSKLMSKGFDYLGPVFLLCIDIEGKLSADGVRWTPPDADVVGLNFSKDGIWHGSRYDASMLWNRALNEAEIGTLAEDPWGMFVRKTRQEIN